MDLYILHPSLLISATLSCVAAPQLRSRALSTVRIANLFPEVTWLSHSRACDVGHIISPQERRILLQRRIVLHRSVNVGHSGSVKRTFRANRY